MHVLWFTTSVYVQENFAVQFQQAFLRNFAWLVQLVLSNLALFARLLRSKIIHSHFLLTIQRTENIKTLFHKHYIHSPSVLLLLIILTLSAHQQYIPGAELLWRNNTSADPSSVNTHPCHPSTEFDQVTGHHRDRSVIRLVGTSRKFVSVTSEIIPSRIVLFDRSRSWFKTHVTLDTSREGWIFVASIEFTSTAGNTVNRFPRRLRFSGESNYYNPSHWPCA